MDTIVALSTPWGRSGVGVIRLSGPDALSIASVVCPGKPQWIERRASLRRAVDSEGETIDEVVALWMKGPKSYTGEDVVEFSGHGNPIILAALIDALVKAGARPARPGEFTRQSLMNGRTDLLQAEAISALINARSMAGVRDAVHALGGQSTKKAYEMREQLLDIAAELEARLDHPDDDLSMESDDAVAVSLRKLSQEATQIADGWESSKVRQDGASVALIGPVNAGKSSLFNHLVGTERALVSERPGTTRDVVERSILMDGLDVTFLDTAGEGGTSDPIEAAGVALGRSLSASADLVLIVVPMDREMTPVCESLFRRTEGLCRCIVGTFNDKEAVNSSVEYDVKVSNVDGSGISQLREWIRKEIGDAPTQGQQTILMSQRQHDLFRSISGHCDVATDALLGALGPAVSATEVVHAVERLGELMGIDAREAVLDRLFSRFCIGK